MKAVFDTNILVSATLWRGSPYRCLLAAQAGLVELFVSQPILAEFTRVLQEKFHLSAWQVAEALAVVGGTASLVEIAGTLRVVPTTIFSSLTYKGVHKS
ncbi:MAG: PIN domain-containing protein [Nitrospiraceae bacterium]